MITPKITHMVAKVIRAILLWTTEHKIFRSILKKMISGTAIHLDAGDVYGFTPHNYDDVQMGIVCPFCGSKRSSSMINFNTYVIEKDGESGVAIVAMHRCDTVTLLFNPVHKLYVLRGNDCKIIEKISGEGRQEDIV